MLGLARKSPVCSMTVPLGRRKRIMVAPGQLDKDISESTDKALGPRAFLSASVGAWTLRAEHRCVGVGGGGRGLPRPTGPQS